MLEKKKAIEILEALRGRILALGQHANNNSPEFMKWHYDVDTAISHIFPSKAIHLNRFTSISFSRSVSRAGEGSNPAADASWFSNSIKRADAILLSMIDEIQTYWSDEGTSVNPYATQADGNTSSKLTKPDARVVFVVCGRNEAARISTFEFLRAIGLNPKEWSQAIKETGEACPYIGHILDSAFSKAQAFIVLMTPDDEAWLKKEFQTAHDEEHEKRLTPQARPNVLFEAGMAMGRDARRTVIVQIAKLGKLRPFSDVAGRHILQMDNSVDRRLDLAQRLETAGCAVDTSGRDWLKAGEFDFKD